MQRAIDQLLRQPEGRHLEFKRAEADPRKVVRTVCAFANTAGGHVVIGVADFLTMDSARSTIEFRDAPLR